MITKYHRPRTISETLTLLSDPDARPLGGGTVLSHLIGESFAVVDLQCLRLDKLKRSGNKFEIGATVTLQCLLESSVTPDALKTSLRLEAPLNLRNMGTVAGTLVTGDGRSPFVAVMLAFDSKLIIARPEHSNPAGSESISLSSFLLDRDILRGKLITGIDIPLNAVIAFQKVARTPGDKPIVSVSLCRWPSGRTRLVLGGWGASPSLALDGTDDSGLELAARNATRSASDQWASSEYRSDIAVVLSNRCQALLNKKQITE